MYCLECGWRGGSTFKILLDFTDSAVAAEARFNKTAVRVPDLTSRCFFLLLRRNTSLFTAVAVGGGVQGVLAAGSYQVQTVQPCLVGLGSASTAALLLHALFHALLRGISAAVDDRVKKNKKQKPKK